MTHGWCSAGVELAWPRNLDISTIIQTITSPVLCPRPASTLDRDRGWCQMCDGGAGDDGRAGM